MYTISLLEIPKHLTIAQSIVIPHCMNTEKREARNILVNRHLCGAQLHEEHAMQPTHTTKKKVITCPNRRTL